MIRKETNVNRIAILLLTIVRMLLETARSMLRSFCKYTNPGVGERVARGMKKKNREGGF